MTSFYTLLDLCESLRDFKTKLQFFIRNAMAADEDTE